MPNTHGEHAYIMWIDRGCAVLRLSFACNCHVVLLFKCMFDASWFGGDWWYVGRFEIRGRRARWACSAWAWCIYGRCRRVGIYVQYLHIVTHIEMRNQHVGDAVWWRYGGSCVNIWLSMCERVFLSGWFNVYIWYAKRSNHLLSRV